MNNHINPDILYDEHSPLSNHYDPVWIFDNQTGPNPLWLAEFLARPFDLKPGMRALNLAYGKGMTSVFLAHEFVVKVYAVDFDEWEGWATPEIRWNNAKEYGVEDLIVPIKADARNLPFAQGFFDAILCVNSYMYFGQEEGYVENLIKFLRPGGQLGMIMTSYVKEVTGDIPEHIKKFLDEELWTWKSLPWWKNLWEKTGLVSIDVADTMPNGCGEYMGMIRLVATKI